MLRYFIRPWTGFQILIGPDANKEGDEYEFCIPLRDTGEFGGYSSTPLTTGAKRAATKAAESLGFPDPFWKDREGKITMAVKKHKIHSIKDPAGLDAEGFLKPDVAAVALHHLIEQVKAGHYKFKPVSEPANGGDGEVVFFRKATDPKAHAEAAPALKA